MDTTMTSRGTTKAVDIIMAADIGVTVIMPVPPAGKPWVALQSGRYGTARSRAAGV